MSAQETKANNNNIDQLEPNAMDGNTPGWKLFTSMKDVKLHIQGDGQKADEQSFKKPLPLVGRRHIGRSAKQIQRHKAELRKKARSSVLCIHGHIALLCRLLGHPARQRVYKHTITENMHKLYTRTRMKAVNQSKGPKNKTKIRRRYKLSKGHIVKDTNNYAWSHSKRF